MNHYSNYKKYKKKYLHLKKCLNDKVQYNHHGGRSIIIKVILNKNDDTKETIIKNITFDDDDEAKIDDKKTVYDFINNIINTNFPELEKKDPKLLGVGIRTELKNIYLYERECKNDKIIDYLIFKPFEFIIRYNIIDKDTDDQNYKKLQLFISEIISMDYKNCDKQKLYLIIPFSANISYGNDETEVKRNVLQGLDIDAVKYAKQTNKCLTLILLDSVFKKDKHESLQTTDYLNMNKTKIATDTDYFNCMKYTLNDILKYDDIQFKKYENYYIFFTKYLGSEWYNILLDINLNIYTIGINFNSPVYNLFTSELAKDEPFNNIYSQKYSEYHKKFHTDYNLYPIIVLKSFNQIVNYL